MSTFIKDPDAVLDFTVDWAANLATDDTIATANFTVPAGITKDSQSNTTTTATVWLSGGTAGTTYNVVCRITTADGRTDDRTLRIVVQDR